jgi:hypothetical protein
MATSKLRLPTVQLAGLVHLPRMLDKIRLHASGELPADYIMGTGDGTCLDGRICRFFKINYDELRALVESGADDEAVEAWFIQQAEDFTPERVLIINQFLTKRGYRDESSAGLEKSKAAAGFGDRADIQTWVDLIMAEEA